MYCISIHFPIRIFSYVTHTCTLNSVLKSWEMLNFLGGRMNYTFMADCQNF